MYCKTLTEATAAKSVGGKAANLSRIQALGIRVPETVVLERGALGEFLQSNGLPDRVAELIQSFESMTQSELVAAHAALTDALHQGLFPSEIRDEVVQAVQPLLEKSDCGLAVRSSAVYEDSETASFAGVFESYLGVPDPDDVLNRIIDCWSTAWSPSALRYMSRMGIQPRADAMAVIIQELVPASSSGVIYTADPTTGNPWQFVLHATTGLSVDLMSGSGAGDTFSLEWDTAKITDRRIGAKPVHFEPTRTGVQRTDRPISDDAEPAITDSQIAEVADVARRLDEALSMRLDIEWAISPNGLTIVQARPLTSLPEYFPVSLDENDRRRTWQPAVFTLPLRVDHAPHFRTPLYGDLSESELWFRHQPDDIVLTGMWKEDRLWHGYLYAAAAKFETFLDYIENESAFEPWLEKNESRYRPRWDARFTELDWISEAASAGIRDTTTAADLIPLMFEVRDRLWDLVSFGWSGPQALGWMCEGALRNFVQAFDPDFRCETVLGGGTQSYTFQVTKSLGDLAASIHEQPVRDAFNRLALDEILPHLIEAHPHCEFLHSLESLCWRLGKFPPSWRNRPLFWSADAWTPQAVHAIKCALQGTSKDVLAIQTESARQRESCVLATRQTITAKDSAAASRFDKLLEWTAYWTQALNDRHGLAAGWLWEKELIWQVGTRMMNEGLFDTPEDVLVLRRADLEAVAQDRDPAAHRAVFADRKREYLRNRRLKPPPFIGKPPAQPHAAQPAPTESADQSAPSDDANTCHGEGFAIGKATGIARRVDNIIDPALLESLTPDDILVLPGDNAFAYADWHSLFTLIKGVVAQGRPAHHISQVARECRVPVIGHVKADLTQIPDGSTIHIDGQTGSIRLSPS